MGNISDKLKVRGTFLSLIRKRQDIRKKKVQVLPIITATTVKRERGWVKHSLHLITVLRKV